MTDIIRQIQTIIGENTFFKISFCGEVYFSLYEKEISIVYNRHKRQFVVDPDFEDQITQIILQEILDVLVLVNKEKRMILDLFSAEKIIENDL